MCGINGIVRLDARADAVDAEELVRVRDAMRDRGPDGAGLWLAPDGSVGLAHRRLAIIDLSDAGHQPMLRDEGRLAIVFNGEIYNYRELRETLARQGEKFASGSDTEVLLALYAREGPRMLARLRGMFALALWDARERTLLLARDPYGIKPLYYAVERGVLRFASQVKALDAAGTLPQAIEPAAVVGFLSWGSVPEPWTWRRAIRALPPGHYLVTAENRVGEPRVFRAFDDASGIEPEPVTDALADSVRAHLVSDVPVGVFLSAGLDSSLIAALARRVAPEPPQTFTLAFEAYAGTPADEAPLAAAVARALGTRHVERRVRREEFLDLWPRALAAMDQPSIDGFNTYVVSRLAREAGLKVVLSGLGGDELFGSYRSFDDVPRWVAWSRRLARVPGLARAWPALARRLRPAQPKLAALLDTAHSLAGAYFLRHALFLPDEVARVVDPALAAEGFASYDPLGHAEQLLGPPPDARDAAGSWRAVHRLESRQFMGQQLLRDSDWASMAHSLELRVPLVDPWLLASVAAAGFEPARSAGKAAVVRAAAPELPPALWTRPKSGFSIPVTQWIDDGIAPGASEGAASRRLALSVLREFGVEPAVASAGRAHAA
jgi:asparagine synthase (glutamine-hydrolysing)